MIKLLALVFMIIDHIGAYLFPSNELIFRIIGRLSMPLFSYATARACYYKKENCTSYFQRLFVFALVSQIPYSLLHFLAFSSFMPLNIGFTWLFGAFFIREIFSLEKPRKYPAWIVPLLLSFFCEYGISGVLYPVLFYVLFFSENCKKYSIALKFTLCGVGIISLSALYYFQSEWWVQFFAILSLPFIFFASEFDNKHIIPISKWFYYAFYPIHICVFIAIILFKRFY